MNRLSCCIIFYLQSPDDQIRCRMSEQIFILRKTVAAESSLFSRLFFSVNVHVSRKCVYFAFSPYAREIHDGDTPPGYHPQGDVVCSTPCVINRQQFARHPVSWKYLRDGIIIWIIMPIMIILKTSAQDDSREPKDYLFTAGKVGHYGFRRKKDAFRGGPPGSTSGRFVYR